MVAVSLALAAVILGVAYLRLKRRWPRSLAVLLLVLSAVSAVLTVNGATLAADYPLLARSLVFGLLTLLIGLTQSALELRRRAANKQPAPLGYLVMGVGFLVSLSSLLIPVIPGQFAPIPILTATPIETAAITRTALPTRTPRVSATPSAPPTLTRTPTALPSLTPTLLFTPTYRIAIATNTRISGTALPSTAGANTPDMAAPLSGCQITVNKNVNLRADRSTDSPLLLTIPYGNVLTGIEQAKGWWHVRYQDQAGWVTKDATTGSAACASLPSAK